MTHAQPRRPGGAPAAGLGAFWRDPTGATSVEFAMVAGVLVVFVFGVIVFGLSAYRRNMVAEAARYGARFLMVRGSGRYPSTAFPSAQFQDSVRLHVGEPLTGSTLSVVADYPDAGSRAPGKRVRVTANYTGSLSITSLIPSFRPDSASAESVILY